MKTQTNLFPQQRTQFQDTEKDLFSKIDIPTFHWRSLEEQTYSKLHFNRIKLKIQQITLKITSKQKSASK